METRSERIKIVNEIIKEIALRGRGFFLNKKDNDMAYILEKKGRLYMYNEYNKCQLYLHQKYGYPPRRFHHGGTLWGLTKDFVEFIKTGADTNHNNGYGGLFCAHWGYPEKDMEAIRDKAFKLGYLRTTDLSEEREKETK